MRLSYPRTKYSNIRTEVDGIKFDSRHEAARYTELKILERAGLIRDLELQHPFELIQKQVRDGKVVERAVKYIADFVYFDKDGNLVVEDAKGMRTDAYKLKKKMMRFMHGIEIKEV